MKHPDAPMLAYNREVPLSSIRFPIFCSHKFDGIRCLFLPDGRIYSRTLKYIPNKNIWRDFQALCLWCETTKEIVDGELVLVDETKEPMLFLPFPEVSSYVMSKDKKLPSGCRLWLKVIDVLSSDEWNIGSNQFCIHYTKLEFALSAGQGIFNLHCPISLVIQKLCTTEKEVVDFFEKSVAEGGEGVILRNPYLGYKHGRTTLREHWMFKVKAWKEEDGIIIGVEPLCLNLGPRTRNELGYSETDSKKENLYPVDMVGSLRLRLEDGTECSIGTWKGATDEVRKELWEQRDSLIGRSVSFRFLDCGIKDKPRIPKDLVIKEY